jgi:group I intron endonuclease
MNGIEDAERIPGIYLIRNIANGKVYVGSSVSVRKRLLNHVRDLKRGAHVNKLLQRAWEKYGAASFVFHALEYVARREDLALAEQRHIDALLAADRSRGYNIVPFADRRTLAPETLAKMSAALKGKNAGKSPSAEVRARISASLKGRPLSPKALEKRRTTLAAQSQDEKAAVARKVSLALKGKAKSPEAVINMSKARSLYWANRRAAAQADQLSQ